MRKATRVSVLLLALCAPAPAGEMQFGAPTPLPPPTSAAEDGVMPNGLPEATTEIITALLGSLMPLF